ncbi:MAG TPA: hypothetical protein VIK77_03255 [Tissierellaceae bacterium]
MYHNQIGKVWRKFIDNISKNAIDEMKKFKWSLIKNMKVKENKDENSYII